MKTERWILLVCFALFIACSGCGDKAGGSGSDDFNVILISIDTLRADHLGVYGNENIKTPHIDRLANEGICFKRAYTPYPTTLPAHVSLMTGTYPTFHGVRNNGIFSAHESLTTLAEVFKDKGYTTKAVIAAYVLERTYGLAQGFDLYDDKFSKSDPFSTGVQAAERKARAINKRATHFLKQHEDGPFFMWLHYYDPHMDFAPPPKFAREYADCLYDGEIAYVDEQIGALLKVLKKEGFEENTIVVIVSDHGEGLMEHNEQEHGILTYDTTLHVPFIIYNPRLFPSAKMIDAQVSLIDVMPTLMDMLGMDVVAEAPDMQGKSLMPIINGEVKEVHDLLYFETLLPFFDYGWAGLRGVRNDEIKYISAPKPELYNTSSDPKELENLYESQKAVAEKFHKAMEETAVRITVDNEGKSEKELDAEAREMLSALGYTSGVYHSGLDQDPFQGANPSDRIWVLPAIYKAITKFKNGDFTGAVSSLEKLRDEEPDNSHVLITLARIHNEMGHLDKAEKYFREHLEIRPNDSQVLSELSKNLHIQGKSDEAITLLDLIMKLYPWEERTVTSNKALIQLERGNLEEAEKLLLKSIELDPNYSNAYNNLGTLCGQRSEHDQAIKYFKKAIAVDPEMGEAYLNCATSYFMMKDIEKAIQYLEKAQKRGAKPNPALLEALGPHLRKR